MRLKDYILNEIGQIEIFSEYLNVSEEDIKFSINFKSKVKSPFHRDSDPSLSFKYYGDRLICRDFSNIRYSGDVFQIVGICIGKDCGDKKQFIEICNDILNTAQLLKDNKHRVKVKDDTGLMEPTMIDYRSRLVSAKDFKYFWKYKLPREVITSNYFFVKTYFINGFPSNYYHSVSDPCYGYVNNPDCVKLYFPFRKKNEKRFISNNRFPIELIHTLTIKDYTVLIKAYKDKLLMDYVCKLLNITNIQFLPVSSESVKIPTDVITLLKNHTNKKLFTMFDLDKCGFDAAFYYRDAHGFDNIFLGDNYSTKDPTDLVASIQLEPFIRRFFNIYKTF